jgi:hypothetical protein
VVKQQKLGAFDLKRPILGHIGPFSALFYLISPTATSSTCPQNGTLVAFWAILRPFGPLFSTINH